MLATGFHRQLLDLVEHVLGDAGAGKPKQLQAREEVAAKFRIGTQIGQQHFVAFGNVEVPGRRDLTQVAHGLLNGAGKRLALVDVEGAAVVDYEADVMIAAGGVMPRRPVDDHRRLVGKIGERLAQHHLVGAPHALRVDHALRHTGRNPGGGGT